MPATILNILTLVVTSSSGPGDAPRFSPPPTLPPAPHRARPSPPGPPGPPTPPTPPPAPRAPRMRQAELAEVPTVTDHEAVVGRFGVGWFGVSSISVGSLSASDTTVVITPALGVRWWVNDQIGVDLGLGVALGSGKRTIGTGMMSMEVDTPSAFGLLGHVGVPIAIHSSAHYTFIVTPEINLGYARTKSLTQVQQGTSARVDRGIRLDVGGRAGAEIQFGFIGVPELALEASVGLAVSYQRGVILLEGEQVEAVSSTTLQSLSVNDPWDFFRSTVAARYYF